MLCDRGAHYRKRISVPPGTSYTTIGAQVFLICHLFQCGASNAWANPARQGNSIVYAPKHAGEAAPKQLKKNTLLKTKYCISRDRVNKNKTRSILRRCSILARILYRACVRRGRVAFWVHIVVLCPPASQLAATLFTHVEQGFPISANGAQS